MFVQGFSHFNGPDQQLGRVLGTIRFEGDLYQQDFLSQ